MGVIEPDGEGSEAIPTCGEDRLANLIAKSGLALNAVGFEKELKGEKVMTQSASDIPAYRYTAQMAGKIEEKWQKYWSDQGTVYADNPVGSLAGPLAQKESFFVMDMFP